MWKNERHLEIGRVWECVNECFGQEEVGEIRRQL